MAATRSFVSAVALAWVLIAFVTSASARPVAGCKLKWRTAKTFAQNSFADVLALSPSNVWAVGGGGARHGLVAHWRTGR
ncbi:MAG TPA: hypothetical protein VF895_08260 [Gaiellaceae bacterium]